MSKKVLDRDMVAGCAGANEQRQRACDDGIFCSANDYWRPWPKAAASRRGRLRVVLVKRGSRSRGCCVAGVVVGVWP